MAQGPYDNCTSVNPDCPVSASRYGYYLNFGSNTFFVALFSLALLAQLFFGLRSRFYQFLVAVGLGTLGETIGYIGRLMLHNNPWSKTGSTIQVVCLILSPSFITAGIYLAIRHLLINYGKQYSRIQPRLYSWIFIGGDVASILMQVAGGGIAAGATSGSSGAKVGNDLLIAGLVSQVVTMAFCASLVADYHISFRSDRGHSPMELVEQPRISEIQSRNKMEEQPSPKAKGLVLACSVAFVTVFIRCVYR